MQQTIFEKYNVPVPRYTSYPPANCFRAISEEEYVSAVRQSNGARDRNLSFFREHPNWIVNLGHGVLADTPFENLKYLVKYIKETDWTL